MWHFRAGRGYVFLYFLSKCHKVICSVEAGAAYGGKILHIILADLLHDSCECLTAIADFRLSHGGCTFYQGLCQQIHIIPTICADADDFGMGIMFLKPSLMGNRFICAYRVDFIKHD